MKLATKFQSYMNQEMIECITHSLCYICVCVSVSVTVSLSLFLLCVFVTLFLKIILPVCLYVRVFVRSFVVICVCPIVFMTEPLMLQLGRPNLLHVTSSLPLLSK